MGTRIDPTPFEPAMPPVVRAAIAEARAGKGPLVQWLNNEESGWGQVSDCFGLLRGHPVELDPVVVGWVVGMGMFGDDLHALPGVIKRERHHRPIPAAIDAFAAGVKAGVKLQKRQWKSIETLAGLTTHVPTSLFPVLPLGLVSDSALARGVALRLAQKYGKATHEPIREALESATGKAARRLTEALEALQASSESAGDGNEPQASARGAPAALGSDEPQVEQPESDLLPRLLEAWCETKDPKLREPIFRLGTEAARKRKALTAKSKGELEGAWLALAQAKDPLDVDRLLGTPWPGAWKAARERVLALSKFPPDPRIAAGVLRMVSQYPSQGSYPLHVSIASLVSTIADPACLEEVDRAKASRPSWNKTYDVVRVTCQETKSKDADPALLEEAKRAGGESKGLGELWSWFWADPTDAQRRLVLADALQSAGDPRGEFITAQCLLAEGGGDAKVRRRAKELLDAHVDAWTGALPNVERSTRRFERGFLVEVRCNARLGELMRSVEVPEWRTVEVLSLCADGDCGPLIRRMPCLRSLAVDAFNTAHLLSKGEPVPSLRALASQNFIPEPGTKAFPNLAVLGGVWSAYRYESELPKLRPLMVDLAASGVPAVVLKGFRMEHLAATLPVFEKVGPKELRLVTGWTPGFDEEGWRVRVRRGSAHADVAWAGGANWRNGSLDSCLHGLVKAGYREIALCSRTEIELDALGKTLGGDVRLLPGDDPIDLAALPKAP